MESNALIHTPTTAADRDAAITKSFGEVSTQRQPETASTAVAAREKAALNARYVMAMERPRNVEGFRLKILADCKRPGFAQVAMYHRPVGGGKVAEGPSIRFVEAALRAYGNISAEVSTVFENDVLRILRVVVTDYESNSGFANEIQIQKAVEKRGDKAGGPPKGREVLSSRLNSYGEPTYLVVATDDEVIVRQAAMVSKTIRTLALRLLPGDIVEEAMDAVTHTMENPGDDRVASIRQLIDGFSKLGVTLEELQTWHGGRDLMSLSNKDLSTLRKIGSSIRDGEAKWTDFMEAKDPTGSVEASEEKAQEILARMTGGKSNPMQSKQSGEKGGGSNPSGKGEPEAHTSQPATSATGTQGAPASGQFITQDQVVLLKTVFAAKGLSDDAMTDFIAAGSKDGRIDHIDPKLFDTVLAMVNAAKAAKK